MGRAIVIGDIIMVAFGVRASLPLRGIADHWFALDEVIKRRYFSEGFV